MSDIDPRPEPLDLAHHYSRITQKRVASSLKKFYKYFSIPGIGNLAGGLPNSSHFPFDTLEADSAVPKRFPIPDEVNAVEPPSSFFRWSKQSETSNTEHIRIPHSSIETDPTRRIDVNTALQYGTAAGFPPLAEFIRHFTRNNMHPNCPYKGGPDIVISCGNTDGWAKCVEAFTNIWDSERDWLREREGVLCEEFAYTGATQALIPRGLNIVPITIDEQGLLVDGKGGLEDVLANWDPNKGKRPHLLYTVSVGQNPTSGILSIERRKQVYVTCQKYDILIIEDEPYWFLQYPSALAEVARSQVQTSGTSDFPVDPVSHNYNTSTLEGKSSGYPFLDSLVPSYISIDSDGRVIRCDTFSKNIAPGCRLGWITAQPALIERFLRITESVTTAPSGFVQSMVAQMLIGPSSTVPSDSKSGTGRKLQKEKAWDTDGWVRWLEGLRTKYENRMQIMSTVLEEGKYMIQDHKTPSTVQSITTNITTTVTPPNINDNPNDYRFLSKTPYYKFQTPMGGMFLWIEMLFESHPLFHEIVPQRLSQAFWILLTTDNYRVLVSPGMMFCMSPTVREGRGWKYFRICFAAIDEEILQAATESFVKACRGFWEIDDVKKIEELERGDAEGSNATDLDETVRLMQERYAINPFAY